MEKGVGKPITLFSPSLPSRSLQCTEVGMRGGDVSIWMVWLRALSAITAMRGAAVNSANQRSRLDGLHRGFFVTVYLVRKGKKKKKATPQWSSTNRNIQNVQGRMRVRQTEKVQSVFSNFPCLWLQMERGKLQYPKIIQHDIHKQSWNITVHLCKQF